MIQANELRIGNWVQRNQKQYRCVSDTIVLFDNGQIELKPIPLTEEWLLRFGFKNWGDKYTFGLKKINVHHRKRGFVFRKSVPVIDYVHQLQNLFFALTGQELTIKETYK